MSRQLRLIGLALCLLTGQQVQAENNCRRNASMTNPLSATLALQKPGLGGTGMVATAPGLGGTGMVAGAPGLGGTGIVGIITGFASICVNGLEVHYDAQTPVSENGQPGHASALAVGQVVVVNASGLGDEVQARQISLVHAAIGPLQSIQASQGRLSLLGQTIQTELPLARLAVGQWVKVSGQRNADGIIQATHLEAVEPQAQTQLSGTLQPTPSGGWTLNGTPVTAPPQAALQAGAEALLKGQWTGSQLMIERHLPEPTRRQIGAVARIVVEGYVQARSAESVTVDHHVMRLDTQHTHRVETAQLDRHQRVRVTASVNAGQTFQIDRIEPARSSNNRSASPNPPAIEHTPSQESENKPDQAPTRPAAPAPNKPAESVRSEQPSRPGGSGESKSRSGDGKSSSGASSSSSSGKSGKSDSGKH